jgi:hypothetical protein
MTVTESVRRLLQEVGEEHGLEPELGDSGACLLELQPGVSLIVEVLDASRTVVVYSPIVPAPNEPEQRLLLFQETLKRNMVQPLLGGGTIGIDPDAAMLTFTIAAGIDGLDARGLGVLLETAYDSTLDLRDALGDETGEADAEEASQLPEPDVIIRG